MNANLLEIYGETAALFGMTNSFKKTADQLGISPFSVKKRVRQYANHLKKIAKAEEVLKEVNPLFINWAECSQVSTRTMNTVLRGLSKFYQEYRISDELRLNTVKELVEDLTIFNIKNFGDVSFHELQSALVKQGRWHA